MFKKFKKHCPAIFSIIIKKPGIASILLLHKTAERFAISENEHCFYTLF